MDIFYCKIGYIAVVLRKYHLLSKNIFPCVTDTHLFVVRVITNKTPLFIHLVYIKC